jgi:hypothetical protein
MPEWGWNFMCGELKLAVQNGELTLMAILSRNQIEGIQVPLRMSGATRTNYLEKY